jgi:hypothetical protein
MTSQAVLGGCLNGSSACRQASSPPLRLCAFITDGYRSSIGTPLSSQVLKSRLLESVFSIALRKMGVDCEFRHLRALERTRANHGAVQALLARGPLRL